MRLDAARASESSAPEPDARPSGIVPRGVSSFDAAGEAIVADYAAALAYEAPYLYEKLVEDAIVNSTDEARALFREVKRYLVLVAADPSNAFEVLSHHVDEVWRQFTLFTAAYARYCRTYFGIDVVRAPTDAPEAPPADAYEVFAAAYARLFDEPPPELWRRGRGRGRRG